MADYVPTNATLSNYTPTFRERMQDWLRRTLFTDDRAGQAKAERITGLLDATPAGMPMWSYDAGRAVGDVMNNPNAPNAASAAIQTAMFLGPMAKTANHALLSEANLLREQGASKREIFNRTGWFQGKDNMWRYEIPDTGFRQHTPLADHGVPVPFRNHFSHPELEKAYPQIGNDLRVYMDKLPPGVAAGYAVKDHALDPGQIIFHRNYPMPNPDTPLHEIQHYVQQLEGFGTGAANKFDYSPGSPDWNLWQKLREQTYRANPSIFNPSSIVNGEEAVFRKANGMSYQHSAGEVEARNTPRRLRQGYGEPPWMTEDVPAEDQIVRPQEGWTGLLGK